MRMLIMFAASLALAACASTPAGNGVPGATTPGHGPYSPVMPDDPRGPTESVAVVATQGLIEVELAYNTAGNAVLAATRAGLIRPGSDLALRIRALNSEAARALGVARAARNVADQTLAVSRVRGLVTALRAIVPGGVS